MKTKSSSSNKLVDINNRIEEYEAKGLFDVDVNIDPPTVPLKPGQVDYSYKKLSTRIKTKIANFFAYHYFERLISKRKLIIADVKGIENFKKVKGGAIITSNHFNAFDNYAIYHVIKDYMNGKNLYKVIREGNYTSFPGIYGFFFRHCNTLPLSSNFKVMKEFLAGMNELLSRGEKVLIYPEQAMWLNYKKPRPYKVGAFNFACSFNVPIIPIFISMEDSHYKDKGGLPIQAYTIHIMEPLYPNKELSARESIKELCNRNYEVVKEKYEQVYQMKLSYSCYQEFL